MDKTVHEVRRGKAIEILNTRVSLFYYKPARRYKEEEGRGLLGKRGKDCSLSRSYVSFAFHFMGSVGRGRDPWKSGTISTGCEDEETATY